MNVTRTSPFTGKDTTLSLDVTQEQLDSYARGGVLLQDAFPGLSKADREFIKTGYTQSDWDQIFGEEEQ